MNRQYSVTTNATPAPITGVGNSTTPTPLAGENTLTFATLGAGNGDDFVVSGVSFEINATVIPEPSTAMLGLVGGLALLRRRRAKAL